MHLDKCGCLWDWEGDTLNILPCEIDKEKVERAKRIAWKLVARRGMSFRQAWEYFVTKLFVIRFLSDLKECIGMHSVER